MIILYDLFIYLYGIIISLILLYYIFSFKTSRKEYLNKKLNTVNQKGSIKVSSQGVLIKGDWKNSIRYHKYVISNLLVLILTIITLILIYSKNPNCESVLGINKSFLAMIQLYYLLPFTALVVTTLLIRVGFGTIFLGYYPPLNSKLLKDTIARKGILSMIRGYIILITPLVLLLLVYFSHMNFMKLANNEKNKSIVSKLERDCKQNR